MIELSLLLIKIKNREIPSNPNKEYQLYSILLLKVQIYNVMIDLQCYVTLSCTTK